MPRRHLLLATLAAALAPAGQVLAQASLRPDPTPRIPPQPGQGLPAQDVGYLQRGERLSRLQVEAGRLAAERATDAEVKRFAARVAASHDRVGQEIIRLARARGVEVPGNQPGAEDRAREAVEKLRAAPAGEGFDRAYLAQELGLYRVLSELHQSQASQSTDQELGRFAIETLVPIRQELDAVTALGARFGLHNDMLANPPQY